MAGTNTTICILCLSVYYKRACRMHGKVTPKIFYDLFDSTASGQWRKHASYNTPHCSMFSHTSRPHASYHTPCFTHSTTIITCHNPHTARRIFTRHAERFTLTCHTLKGSTMQITVTRRGGTTSPAPAIPALSLVFPDISAKIRT